MSNNPSASTTAEILRFQLGDKPLAIAKGDRTILKRDGTAVPFELTRIARAIALAFFEVRNGTQENPNRDFPMLNYGLGAEDMANASKVAASVELMLETFYAKGNHPSIEDVQNAVELALAGNGFLDVARAYMAYRTEHAQRRLSTYLNNGGLAEYVENTKYARYRDDLGRREVYAEMVDRGLDMHRTYFRDKLRLRVPSIAQLAETPLAGRHADFLDRLVAGKTLEQLIEQAYAAVRAKRVLPSMRSIQFGGTPILAKHARMFNCAFSHVDRVEFFREYFYMLLCGCGCGFSVQKHHIAHLDSLPQRPAENELPVVHFHIEDSIEGWADAVDVLFQSFYQGKKVEFCYANIRPRGAVLRTSGGKAPGHLPLKSALGKVEEILIGASGRKLRSIEIYDINMFLARAVLAGGVRRSATICLFSPDDEEMMNAKTGDWFTKNPQRSASNNSAVLSRNADNETLFARLFKAQMEFGEPGFLFCDDPEAGVNPCAEILLKPVLQPEQMTPADQTKLYRYTFDFIARRNRLDPKVRSLLTPIAGENELAGIKRMSGFQVCNLTTINAAANSDSASFLEAVVNAAVLGTLQAAFTDIPYLSPVTRVINERDALLGISICGFLCNPKLYLDRDVLTSAAHLARATNRIVARLIGINHAARLTTVKPEGTAALILGAPSGIHPYRARQFFRRVQANRKEDGYQAFRARNPQMCEVSAYHPETDDVITFPVTAPKDAIVSSDLDAISFLKLVRLVQTSWVHAGQDSETRDPHLHHNVSNTCAYEAEEADAVRQFIWEHRADFTGISLLRRDGKTYVQAPEEPVTTEADVLRWNALRPKPVNYASRTSENTSNNHLNETVACAGGACMLV